MKALSVKQPWASLIVRGAPVFKAVDIGENKQEVGLAGVVFKDVENRKWKTNYRGRVLIHASKRALPFEYMLEYLNQKIGISVYACLLLSGDVYSPRGVILGEVDIVDCIDNSTSPWAEQGQYHLIMSNPKAYKEPVPCRGQLGFFEPDIVSQNPAPEKAEYHDEKAGAK